MEAAHRYDPTRGPFPAFAFRSVAGAMHDFARLETRELSRELKVVQDEWARASAPADAKAERDALWGAMDQSPEEAKASAIREQRLRVERMVAVALLYQQQPIDPEALFLEAEDERRAAAAMNAALAKFTPMQRETFLLYRTESLTLDAVAERLRISKSSVRRYVEDVEAGLKEGLVAAEIESQDAVRRAWFVVHDPTDD